MIPDFITRLRWSRYTRALSKLEKAQRNLAEATRKAAEAQWEYNKMRKACNESDR